jgi:hypothetical protein
MTGSTDSGNLPSTSPRDPMMWLTEKARQAEALSKPIIALTIVLGTLLAQVLPEQTAKTVATITVLATGAVLFFGALYLDRRHLAATPARSENRPPADTHPGQSLRGLSPFQEGEHLPARSAEAANLDTMVRNAGFRIGVVYGETGSGKTSLLQAGLISRLRDNTPANGTQTFLPVYIASPRADPEAEIRAALRTLAEYPPSPDPRPLNDVLRSLGQIRAKPIVVIIDQFEQFIIASRDPKAREPFFTWLCTCIHDKTLSVRFVLGIRFDYEPYLNELAQIYWQLLLN